MAFIDDAAAFPPASIPLTQAVEEHRSHRTSDYADLLGGFVVSDLMVGELAAAVASTSSEVTGSTPLRVSLVVTGGAGAISPAVTWVARTEGIALGALEFALRDEDDLAHNAGRLLRVLDSVEEELDDVAVYAEPPMPRGSLTHGWLAAVDELAAREIALKFRTGGASADLFPSPVELASCIEAALDRELPFKCSAGLHHAVRHLDVDSGIEHHGFLNVLLATRASLDGEGDDEVARLLADTDGAALAARLSTDPDRAARTRRWFTGVRVVPRARGARRPGRAPADREDRMSPDPHSWVPGAAGSAYDADNLPYGVFSVGDAEPRVGARIGDQVLDLTAALGDAVFHRPSLNEFMALGTGAWRVTRRRLVQLVTDPTHREQITPLLHPMVEVTMHLPFEVADYVDFYCSLQHATNAGKIFRPDGAWLLPNWRHLPVGYHGRAGTVVVSGTDVIRPCGQSKPSGAETPTYGPTRRLDIEAELGFVVGLATRRGDRVPTAAFEDHVFGVTPLNDWSARDIQAWESAPLGPFLGKSFATSISAWITPLEALGAARTELPVQEPAPLDYLQVEQQAGYDIEFEVELNGEVVSRPPYASMYWSPAQMLAHLTVNGASLRTGTCSPAAPSAGTGPTSSARSSSSAGTAASPSAPRDAPSSTTATR